MSINLETTALACRGIKICSFLTIVGEVIDTGFLAPISVPGKERFIPKKIYVRKEMCEVFQELIKSDRRQKQILIGSPGIGKSVLLFLVALYRALYEEIPVCFIRKTRNSQELTSVFFMVKIPCDKKKTEDIGGAEQELDDSGRTSLTIHFSRKVAPDEKVVDVLKSALQAHGTIEPDDALSAVLDDEVLLFIDGCNEGDADLNIPHHYLATSGGYDIPQGESAKYAALVVLGGWQRTVMKHAIALTSDILTRTSKADGTGYNADSTQGSTQGTIEVESAPAYSDCMDVSSLNENALDAAFSEDVFEDIFYHTGGRIREAFEYAQDPELWKLDKMSTISSLSKETVRLSITDTKASTDPRSADRIRTMFKNEKGAYFGSAFQIVDSQFYARLLRDRVGIEDYYNAYVHAMWRGLFSAAGCHFEELLHQTFHKRPSPIQYVLQSTGKGKDGVNQFSSFSCYWIPSISNFANIDAAVAVKHSERSMTIWCLQYTVSKEHTFNQRTFVSKFLRPLQKNFGIEDISVKIIFVVPEDIYTSFKLPESVVEADYDETIVFADCSSVEAVDGLFEKLDFIDKPVTLFDAQKSPQRARLN